MKTEINKEWNGLVSVALGLTAMTGVAVDYRQYGLAATFALVAIALWIINGAYLIRDAIRQERTK